MSSTPRPLPAGRAAQLQYLYSRSLSLAEILEQRRWPSWLADDLPRWLQHWKQRVSKGNDDHFARRLRWAGIDDPAQLLQWPRQDGIDVTDSEVPLPRWLALTERFLDASSGQPADSGQARRPLPPATAETAFAPALSPLTALGIEMLQQKVANDRTGLRIDGQLRSDLELFFTEQLSRMASGTLFARFESHRQRYRSSEPPAADSRAERQGPAANPVFSSFVDACLSGGWAEILTAHPLLARALTSLVINAVDALAEMARRLNRDRQLIKSQWGDDFAPARLRGIRAGLSDRHNRGRQVARLEFESGPAVYYKPKPVGFDVAYQQLSAIAFGPDPAQDRTAQQAAHPPTIDCGSYGWCAEVASQEASSAAAVDRYYRRSGRLLALAYSLEGRDLIMDNIIAGPDGPLAIDCEALVQPLCLPAIGTIEDRSDYLDRLWPHRDWSVLETGLLPRWQTSGDRSFYDISGLGGVSSYTGSTAVATIEAANTDDMRRHSRLPRVGTEKNALLSPPDGAPALIGDHLDALIDGFSEAWQQVIDRRAILDDFLAGEQVQNASIRLLYRSTGIYGRLLLNARSKIEEPDLTGLDKSLVFEQLYAPLLASDELPGGWHFACAEVAALERWDIPHFSLAAGEMDEPRMLADAITVARRRLRGLDENERQRQLALIKNSVEMHPARVPREGGFADIAMAICGNLARRLQAGGDSVPASDCRIISHPGRGDTSAPPLEWLARCNLYSGSMGSAVFLAALATSDGNEQAAQSARELLAHARETVPRSLSKIHDNDRQSLPGATSGIAGVIYSAMFCSRALEDTGWSEWAGEVCRELLPGELFSDVDSFDVSGGLAGTILCLCAAHRANHASEHSVFLDSAIAAGHRLLRCNPFPPGHASDPACARNRIRYLGFAHGLAGVAAAFARLGSTSGHNEFDQAANDCLRVLAGLAPTSAEASWPIAIDGDSKPIFQTMDSWCHGSPGIGLALCEMLDSHTLPTDAQQLGHRLLAREIDRIAGLPAKPNEDLCCGNASRIEALLRAGEVVPDSAAHDQAQRLANDQLQRRDVLGLFPLGQKPSDTMLLLPGFFRGVTGIGYTLLRCTATRTIPSIAALKL